LSSGDSPEKGHAAPPRRKKGFASSVKGAMVASYSGVRHFFKPRLTLKYPEQKLDLQGPGYSFDAKAGVGRPGFKGRHLLIEDKCTGCQLCAIACDGIAVAIDMQKLDLKRTHNKKDIWPAVDYGRCVYCGLCVDYLTEIVTNPGLTPISEIVPGEMVLTHTGEYKPVTKVWDMTYTGPMFRISVFGKPQPLVCTADHKIVAVSRPHSNRKDGRLLRVTNPLEFLKPGELKEGDYLVTPIVRKIVHTEKYEKDVPTYRGGKIKRRMSLDASPELFRLIGYYLAEGSCDGGRRVVFDFKENERDTLAKDCNDLMIRFFEEACKTRKSGRHGLRLVLDSAMAEDFFSQFGKGAAHRKLPDWVFFAEPEKQLELVRGEWHCDGTRIDQPRQKFLNITTTSKTLAFQIQSIYARLGLVSTIDTQRLPHRLRSYHVNVFGRWAVKLAEMWGIDLGHAAGKFVDRFHIDDHYVYQPIRNIEVEEVVNRRVMDVTVQDDHTFAPAGLATSNCVDACPFDALVMTNEYEMAAYDKESLKYTPEMLFVPPKPTGKYKVKIDPEKGTAKHG
jgi:NADH-quinone oxidoreductase subunit I